MNNAAFPSMVRDLNPAVKIAALICWTISLFAIENWFVLIAIAILLLIAYVSAECRLELFARALVPFSILAAVLVLSGSITAVENADSVLFGFIGFDLRGFERATKAVMRFAEMILLSLLFTETTSESRLTASLQSMLGSLRRFHVPVDELVTMLVIALRFIPLCAERMDHLKRAQKGRGIDIGKGGLVRRVLSYVSLIAPLVVSLFKLSDDLANAMVARCYRGQNRTQLYRQDFKLCDKVFCVVGLATAVILAVLY